MIKRFPLHRTQKIHFNGYTDFDLDTITSLQDRYRNFDYTDEKVILNQIADLIIRLNNYDRDHTLWRGYLVGDDENFDEEEFNLCNRVFLQKAASMGYRNAIDELIIINSEDISKLKHNHKELQEKYKDVVEERDSLSKELGVIRILIVALILILVICLYFIF